MFRFVFEFIGLLIFFAFVRTVITTVLRLFANSVQAPQPPAERPVNTANLQTAGELRKDPVCGTFVPVESSLKRVVGGKPVYFCSPECRDRY